MLEYTILLFGPAADAAGADRIVVRSVERCCCGEILLKMAECCPVLEGSLQVGRLAVNHGFVVSETLIEECDEIALITMVSGG